MASKGETRWLHPATAMQAMLEGANHNNLFLNVYTLTLCSAAPLQHHHVRQALLHLFRKVPTLRLCLKRRDGLLWMCEMDHEEIDFQVVEGDSNQVTEDLGTYKYNVSKGPLWCARLLSKEKNPMNPRTDIESAFPYTCSLALGNHHAIADGTTNTFIIEFFLQILNDVIAGENIDDSKQMAEYKGAKELDDLINAQDKELEKDPARLEVLLKEIKEGPQEQPLLCRVLPPIYGVPYKSRFLETVFDTDTTKRFITKCKENGITVNSGVVALLNVTLMEYMREAGLKREEYPIQAAHAVNMRRYLPKEMSNIIGAHITLLVNTLMVPANWQDSFWNYAKRVHKEFLKGLVSDTVEYLCLIRRAYYYNDSFQEAFSKPSPPSWDHITATMGNLDTRIITEGNHVRLGHLLRFSANAFDPLMHMYHTFRGRLCFSVTYSVNLLSEETAQKMIDLFVKILNSQV